MRTERGKSGGIQLDNHKLYGIQTARAVDNFALDYKKTNLQLIYAIVTVKKAAAMTYQKLGIGKDGVYAAIDYACDMVLKGKADDAFVTDALQGGAGTSTNMNVNEVIANLALQKLGFHIGSYDIIHPLDDVNRGQSTNDVYPTALRIAAIQMLRKLSESCAKLQQALQTKENEFDNILKLGRTELMDAIPITLGQEFGSYAQAIARDRWRLYKVEERLRQVNIGGTAVGAGNNAERKYRFGVIEVLRELTGIGLAAAEYPMDITQNNDVFVEVSGLLKALSVNLMKISNDLRLMNSGPKGGLSEITLAPMQIGSTIMPGKVNPVIPEMIMQVSMRVMANDFAISTAASHGEFELNAFLPLIADSLLESLALLTNAAELFRTKCIELIKPNPERCKELLELSYAFATAYTPLLGYDKVCEIIEKSSGNPQKAKEMLDD
ncbi:aspartate ammonia-lyase [Desulfitobacterium sp. AusDCA]|uniref:aspartate ammonia-lyase n=1 Tax=Desulfitobacterium sp. AusDCA TaxID=3240383 RepID=UPI003DA750F7